MFCGLRAPGWRPWPVHHPAAPAGLAWPACSSSHIRLARDLSQHAGLWWLQTLLLPGPRPPHQLSILTWAERSLEGKPGRAQRGGSGWWAHRGRTEGPRTARGHVAGKEQAQSGPKGGAAWWLLLRGGRGLQWRKLGQSTHGCPQGQGQPALCGSPPGPASACGSGR